MSEDLKQNLSRSSIWMRLLYMLLFTIFYSLAEVVIVAVVIVQFLIALVTGNTNRRVLQFGKSLSTYVYQVLRYLTFNSEARPFPFGDWPEPSRGTNKSSRMANAEESWTTKPKPSDD